jgi:hypothetical protein
VKLENLKMPPYNTTMMGVVKGALDFYGLNMSPAMAFGGSGHAFLINIHDELCPSGPYCWNYDPFYRLLRNLGVAMTDLGFFHAGSSPAERAGIEQTLKEHLDRGKPCSFCNMENQTIHGYDDQKFLLGIPWKPMEITPETLTLGSWQEFGKEIHVNFFVFEKLGKQDDSVVIRDSLSHAVDLFRNPRQYTGERYGVGPNAYDNWAKANETGHGASHGNWWNAQVWSECRQMAAGYFTEIAALRPGEVAKRARVLSRDYREIAGLLAKAGDKELGAGAKAGIIRDLKTREASAISQVEELLRLLA